MNKTESADIKIGAASIEVAEVTTTKAKSKTITVPVLVENKRGCGYRKSGDTYLVNLEEIEIKKCERIPAVLDRCPVCNCGIKPTRGSTIIFVAHRKLVQEKIDDKEQWRGGIFGYFIPTELQYVVRDEDTEADLEAKIKRGIKPVRVKPREYIESALADLRHHFGIETFEQEQINKMKEAA